MKKFLSSLLVLLLVLGALSGCGGKEASSASSGSGSGSSAVSGKDTLSAASAKPEASSSEASKEGDSSEGTSGRPSEASKVLSDLVILYTNDVHCGVDDKIGYAGLGAYRKELEEAGKTVLLVDAGDSIQGADIGMMTSGEAVIRLMNAMKYDVATIGNHEFDYTMERLFELTEMADYPYVCCNLTDKATGSLLFDAYTMIEACGKKIAFVGAVTPKTLISSTPTFFKGDDGEYLYDFCIDEDGTKLYSAVQKAVDEARAKGADLCILLSHLGVDSVDSPYMAGDVIANTTGIDVVLDGHSHSVVPSELVKNKDGKEVLYSQTGTKLENIGKLTFDDQGRASCELISEYAKKDAQITKLIEELRAQYEEKLNEYIGHTAFDLTISDEDGNRIVRNAETNLADLVMDAFRYAVDAEVAIGGGGNIRVDVKAGELTNREIYAVLPFDNDVVLIEATGQQIADALELGASAEPEEFGGFAQVSGITYTLDMRVPTGVSTDENGQLVGIEGERRVKDIKINGEPLDPKRVYTIGGTDYYLLKGGDGYTMFEGCEQIIVNHIKDAKALSSYIKDVCEGEIPKQYADRHGDGRITLIS